MNSRARPLDQLARPSLLVCFPDMTARAHPLDQPSHPSPHKRIRLATSIPDALGKLINHDSSSLGHNHDDNLVALF